MAKRIVALLAPQLPKLFTRAQPGASAPPSHELSTLDAARHLWRALHPHLADRALLRDALEELAERPDDELLRALVARDLDDLFAKDPELARAGDELIEAGANLPADQRAAPREIARARNEPIGAGANLEPDTRADRHENGDRHARRVPWASRIPGWLGPAAAAVTLLSAAAAFGNHYFTLREDRSDLKHDVSQLENEVADVTPRLSRSERLNRDYADLVASALQKGQLSEHEVRRFVPDRTDAGSLPAAVKITDPAENERVADGTFVRGSSDLKSVESRTCWKDGCSTALPRSHRTIWILTQPAGVNRYYPQGSSPDEAGPATVDAGNWVSPAVLFGPTPDGTGVLIHAVVADREAEEAFKDYLRTGASTKEFPGLTQGQLPKGARFRHSVRVTFRGAR